MALSQDALWYKDAIIYQVHVRAFYDSTGDGVGDFRGLAQKLDYLQELGINALWLMPFFPSLPRSGPPTRHSRNHRDGAEPYFESASLVSGVSQFA